MRPSVALSKSNSASNTEERNVCPRIECSLPPSSSWIELFDKSTNKWYYYNEHTKVSQWEKPSDFSPRRVPLTYARSSNFSAQKQQPHEESLVNPLRSRFETDFPTEYPPRLSKLLGAVRMENNPKQQNLSWVSITPPVNVTGSNSDLESAVHNSASNTEERTGCSLPPPFSWVELFDKSTNKWYYYNEDTKVSQWEKPSDFSSRWVLPTYARSSNFSAQKQQPHEETPFRSWFEEDFPREYSSQPSKLLGAIYMENNLKQQDMSWVSGTPPVNDTDLESAVHSYFSHSKHLELDLYKLNAEQTPAHTDIICFDGNLPSPWWELNNEKAGIRYYWHSVLNVTQSERPSCLPPIQPCSTCGCNVQRGIEQTQQCQELQALAMTNNQQDKWVAVSPIDLSHEPRLATGPDTNFRSKKSLYLSFHNDHRSEKWYHVNLSGNINEDGSRHELITNLLDEASQGRYRRGFTVLNSSIYTIANKSRRLALPTFILQVLETQSQERPAWKELTPLAKNHVQPWAVSMHGKIYVVGAKNKGNNFTPNYHLNEIEIISDLESSKWEKLPVHPLKFNTPDEYFVLAFQDENKLIIGSGTDKCLYLYNVCTHELEMLDFSDYIGMQQGFPPVLVGNRLFTYSYTMGIIAYDLVEGGIWEGMIDGLEWSYFPLNCNKNKGPVLIYLGGDKLCLVCLKTRRRKRKTSVVHLCIFNIPEFRVQGGKRSLHGHFYSVHKFYVEKLFDLKTALLV